MPAESIQPGDRVHDRDDPDPNDAIVVTPQSQTAAEWDLAHADGTLADDNPDYPDDAPAITVVFVDDLIEYGPPFDPTDRTPLSMSTLNDTPVHYYTFPAPRLHVIESPATGLSDEETATDDDESVPDAAPTAAETTGEEDGETEPATDQPVDDGEAVETEPETDEIDPSPELQTLKTTLEDNGLTVEITDAETLTVERLGQTYHVRPDDGVEGDGALRSKLETIVDNA